MLFISIQMKIFSSYEDIEIKTECFISHFVNRTVVRLLSKIKYKTRCVWNKLFLKSFIIYKFIFIFKVFAKI